MTFDIDRAKSGKYNIVNREGEQVRIICWDNDENIDFPIIGLINGQPILYNIEGLCDDRVNLLSKNDLHLELKDSELTAYEKKLKGIIQDFMCKKIKFTNENVIQAAINLMGAG